MMPPKILLIILFSILLCANAGYAQDDSRIYSAAVKAAQQGEFDSAFMLFHDILTGNSCSKYYRKALFAAGEYYFLANDYRDATKAFIKFVNSASTTHAKMFALVYLFKIAQAQENDAVAQGLKNKIINLQELALVFKDYNEYRFDSPLGKRYRLRYYIDKAQCYKGEELFADIPY